MNFPSPNSEFSDISVSSNALQPRDIRKIDYIDNSRGIDNPSKIRSYRIDYPDLDILNIYRNDRQLRQRKFYSQTLTSQLDNALIRNLLVGSNKWPTMPVQSEIFTSFLISKNKNNWLESALVELAGCRQAAKDEDIDEPSDLSIEKAQILIKRFSQIVENHPDIYPMDEGSIAIDFRNPDIKSGILFLIERDGSGACFARNQKSKSRSHFTDAVDLLDESSKSEFSKHGIN